MSRAFDGVDDFIQFSTGAVAAVDGGPITLAIILKAKNTAGAGIFAGTSVSNVVWSMELFGGTWFASYNGGVSSLYGVRDEEWVLLAFTKASGSDTPREHEYRYNTDTWAHAASASAVNDGGVPGAGGVLTVARWSTAYLEGNIAVAGIWSSVLSDGDLETLTEQLSAWEDLSPAVLWAFNQDDVGDPVQDLTGGGANQTAITGTTVSADEPPGFSYGGAVASSGTGWAAATGTGASAKVALSSGRLYVGAIGAGAAAKTGSGGGSLRAGVYGLGRGGKTAAGSGRLRVAGMGVGAGRKRATSTAVGYVAGTGKVGPGQPPTAPELGGTVAVLTLGGTVDVV